MPPALHPDLFPCTKCSEHFNGRDEQAKHLRVSHGLEEPWLCYRCPEALHDRAGFMLHMTHDHRGKADLSPCGDCGAQLTSDDMLVRHIQHDHKEQVGREKVECLKCGFSNNSCIGISIHLLHEHSPKCQYCGVGFIKTVDLALHEEGKGVGGECPAKPKPRAPTPPPPPPPPPPSLASLLPPLPDFVLLGRPDLTPQDFDPKTFYESTTATTKAYRACPEEVDNAHLFNADPKMLAFGNLIRLAEQYSNRDIFDMANAGRTGRAQPAFQSLQTVETRLAAALKWTATKNNVALNQVKAKFDQIRAGNGISVRRSLKRTGDESGATSNAQHHGMPPRKHIKMESLLHASPVYASGGIQLGGGYGGFLNAEGAWSPRYDTPAADDFMKQESWE